MHWIEVVFMALGLAMDACAVCVGVGASGLATGKRSTFRLSFHFGLFQFLMPVIGWYLGSTVAPYIKDYDHWIAFALLGYVGTRMIRESFRQEQEFEAIRKDPSRGWSLVMLSIATSIDALAVGLSLAMVDVTIWLPSIAVGVITGGLSVLGLVLGRKLGSRFGRGMEIFGGIILNLIGLRILLTHIQG